MCRRSLESSWDTRVCSHRMVVGIVRKRWKVGLESDSGNLNGTARRIVSFHRLSKHRQKYSVNGRERAARMNREAHYLAGDSEQIAGINL